MRNADVVKRFKVAERVWEKKLDRCVMVELESRLFANEEFTANLKEIFGKLTPGEMNELYESEEFNELQQMAIMLAYMEVNEDIVDVRIDLSKKE